ncbi:acyl carrier protein [Amycolatopsis speibonae]|uniref:Acyl carrier protein n=1 Tax=Amycolatopsis speibonae TaxID=1450224 RepID=A0ABV7P266_9PSEU
MSTNTAEHADVHDRILSYVRDELADAAERDQVTSTTSLLEAGILDSLRTARLVAWLRDEVGARVPPIAMTGKNFRDVDSITDLAVSLLHTT